LAPNFVEWPPLTSPASAFSGGDLGVAGGTQTHKVVLGIRAALGKRLDMVYFLGGCDPSALPALLAEGVRRDVAVADSFPRPAVLFFHGGITLVAFVLSCFLFGVFLAEPAARQLRAA